MRLHRSNLAYFTLLELLLAGSLGLLTAGLAFDTIRRGMDFWREEQLRFRSWSQARLLIEALNRDLHNTVSAEPTEAATGYSDTDWTFLGTPDRLRLIVHNVRFPGQGPLVKLEYALGPDPSGPSGLAVHRRVWNRQGDLLAERSFSGIDQLSLRYLAGAAEPAGSWQPLWPTARLAPPRAVKAVIQLSDRSQATPGQSLSTLVSIQPGRKP